MQREKQERGKQMKRTEAISRAAKDVADAADFTRAGTENIFGQIVTPIDVVESVRAAIDRLQNILAATDVEWDAKWAASEAEERRVEEEAWKFAAGKA
jgi:hypothetical protein